MYGRTKSTFPTGTRPFQKIEKWEEGLKIRRVLTEDDSELRPEYICFGNWQLWPKNEEDQVLAGLAAIRFLVKAMKRDEGILSEIERFRQLTSHLVMELESGRDESESIYGHRPRRSSRLSASCVLSGVQANSRRWKNPSDEYYRKRILDAPAVATFQPY